MDANGRTDAAAEAGSRRAARSGPDRAQRSHARVVDVRLESFDGGVGLWGAVPASYDTTRLPMDRGIHVHARSAPVKAKDIDRTYSAVRILSDRLPLGEIVVSEMEAIYYMISTVFGMAPQNLICPKCANAHLDQDWYSVHPHVVHHCEACGGEFESAGPAVGNPIVTVRQICDVPQQKIVFSEKSLEIRQSDYQNGLLIWGSNPAFLWTGQRAEQEGMHVHVFGESGETPELDETYGRVRIDGIDVDPATVRLLMAQLSLPMLRDRVATFRCPGCDAPQFDRGPDAFTPKTERNCGRCGLFFSVAHAAVSNPALETFIRLSRSAQRSPQHYTLQLPSLRPAA